MTKDPKKLIEFLRAEDGFTILPHLNPDGDALGSGVALLLVLRAIGKKAQYIVNESIPFAYNTMPIEKYITRPEDAFEAQNVICVDVSEADRLGEQSHFLQNAKEIAVIDHHISNKGFGDFQWVEPKAAATAEIVFQIAESLGVEMKGDLATCLMIALSTDTGHFSFRNTTARTLEFAAKLLSNGVNLSDISYDVYHRKTLGRTKLMGKAIQNLQIFCDGKAGMVTITKQELDECQCDQSDCEGLIDIAREVDGVEVSVLLRENGAEIKGSFRSRNGMDVSILALKYNGGGHKAAAGFSLSMNLEESIKEIKTMLQAEFNKR